MNAVSTSSGRLFVDGQEVGEVTDVKIKPKPIAIVGGLDSAQLRAALKEAAAGKVEVKGVLEVKDLDVDAMIEAAKAKIEKEDNPGPKPWKAMTAAPLMCRLMEVGSAQVRECGHDMDPRSLPKKRNCQHCWFAYFLSHPPVVAAAKVTFGNTALTYAEKKTTITRSITDKGFKFVEEFISQLEQYEAQKAAQEAAELAKAKQDVAEIVSEA